MSARCWSAFVFVSIGSACVFGSERRPAVDVNLLAASAYVFRGQTMTDAPVLQSQIVLGLPTRDGGTATAGAFGNLDLTDHTGEAWFDDDHAGEFTQTDWWAAYGRTFAGVTATVGARHYSWPNGEGFRSVPFPSTSEVFATAEGEVAGFTPSLALHYDVDEVESLYARVQLARTFALASGVRLEAQAWLGWSDEDHSLWLYRTERSALGDAGANVALAIAADDVTTVRVGVSASTIVDDRLRDWFDRNVDADVVWVHAGVGWAW